MCALQVGKVAPEFSGQAVVNNEFKEVKLSDYRGKKVVFFFYPLDFTFVCPTELLAFDQKLDAFRERGCEIIGCSVDSVYSHFAWLNTPRKEGGIQGVRYPIISDLTRKAATDYGVLLEGEGVALRGLFLIDEEGVLQHQVINNLPLGRNVDEALRMVDSLAHFQEHGEVCPANWQRGEKSMKADPEGSKEFFSTVE